MNTIYRIFWFFAGSDPEILAECTTSERNKHFGIGATILITAVIAVLSASYAIRTLVDSIWVIWAIALFWGAVIFTIDRLLVASMKKSADNNKWKETLAASPRLLLAIGIALVISKPIEVKILENQINKAAASEFAIESKTLDNLTREASNLSEAEEEITNSEGALAKLDQETDGITQEPGYQAILREESNCERTNIGIQSQIDPLRQKIIDLKNDSRYWDPVTVYVDKNGIEHKQPIPDSLGGSTPREVKVTSAWAKGTISGISKEISGLEKSKRDCSIFQQQRSDYRKKREEEIAKDKAIYEGNKAAALNLKSKETKKVALIKERNDTLISIANRDLFGKLIILEKAKNRTVVQTDTLANREVITYTREESTMMAKVSWAIMFFFFVLEICPIFVKIITDRGPYDEILSTQEIIIREEQLRKQEEVRLKEREKVNQRREMADQRLNNEIGTNQEVLDEIARARIDIAKRAVEKWKEQQLHHLESAPDEFLSHHLQN